MLSDFAIRGKLSCRRNMKIFTGFAFTEEPITHLKDRGFSFYVDKKNMIHGYQSFFAILKNDFGFEIRKIIEEQEYLKFIATDSFKPLEAIQDIENPFRQHANTVSQFKASISATSLSSLPDLGPMKIYFQIRKASDLWALWIECDDFSVFTRVAKPDQIFDWNGQKTALIHLAPNCFDLLVTQK